MLSARVWRSASDAELPVRTKLRAGPLVLWREEADICSVTLDGTEIIRRIYAAVRDRNWGTVPAALSNLQEEIGEDFFRVSFDVDNTQGPISFRWKGLMTGSADGVVTFTLDGAARSTFLKNRIGFCILHPDSCAGAACRLTHADGSVETSAFPRRISPHQPFLDLRGISHEVIPGTWADVAFEGDVFETEDQRNWTDASFKTYCTPLAMPFPAQITEGTRVFQSVTLRLRTERSAPGGRVPRRPPRAPAGALYDARVSAPGTPLAAIGLGSASHGHELSAREVSLLRALRPDHLRVDLDFSRGDAARRLNRAAHEAAALGAALEVALILSDDAAHELADVARLVAKAGCPVARWLVFHARELCTSQRWVALARDVLAPAAPGVLFASGTNAYFTELNRGDPPGPSADALVYSINPQIHAFDNASIMETLTAQPATVESARAIGGARPIFISPVTLKPRTNVVATGPEPPVPAGELPPQVDARQMSLFAAAWTLGCVAALAGSGVAGVTLFETTGWRGVMEEEAGPPVPQRFPSLPGCVFPLYHVLADIAELKGASVVVHRASSSPEISGLTLKSGSRLRTLVANLTASALAARIAAAGPVARVRRLDETTAERACRAPADFRAGSAESVRTRRGALEVELLPYAVLCIDWEGLNE